MEIKVFDYISAFQYVYNHSGYSNNRDFAMISIQEYPSEIMGMEYKTGGPLKAALNLWFSDIKDQKDENPETYIKMIDEYDAKTIKDFVDYIKKMDIDFLIVHCHAGISRSAAVAAAISKVETGSDEKFFNGEFVPNMKVYYAVLKAFGYDNTPLMGEESE